MLLQLDEGIRECKLLTKALKMSTICLIGVWLKIDRAVQAEGSKDDEEVCIEEEFRENSNVLSRPTEGTSNSKGKREAYSRREGSKL